MVLALEDELGSAQAKRLAGGAARKRIDRLVALGRVLISLHEYQAARERIEEASAARMTLRELERWIGWEIAGNYHQRIHTALNRPPIAA
jgi:hypothetical protein